MRFLHVSQRLAAFGRDATLPDWSPARLRFRVPDTCERRGARWRSSRRDAPSYYLTARVGEDMTPNDSDRARIDRALELLKCGLARFVADEFRAKYQERDVAVAAQFMKNPSLSRPITEWDVAPLLSLMVASWNEVFRPKFPESRVERSLVFQLRDVRNRWAHQQSFSKRDANRAIDWMQLLLAAVGAPEAADLEKLLEFAGEPRAEPADSPATTTEREIASPETPSTPLLLDDQHAQLRARGELILHRGDQVRRAARFWFAVWVATLVGAGVLAWRWLTIQGQPLWVVISGTAVAILGACVAFGLLNSTKGMKAQMRRTQEVLLEEKELPEITKTLQRDQEEQLRREEEELPVLPPLPPVESHIQDPFIALVVQASGTNARIAELARLTIREKLYPNLLKQALTWWQEDRPNVDAYVRAHFDEILTREKEIQDEFTSDMNFTVDIEGCRRLATWALRHRWDEVRYYLPDLPSSAEPVTPRDLAVERLAKILRTWGGHKYEMLLPRARALKAAREIPIGLGASGEGFKVHLEGMASEALRGQSSSVDPRARLCAEVDKEIEKRRAAGTPWEELNRLRAEWIAGVDVILAKTPRLQARGGHGAKDH